MQPFEVLLGFLDEFASQSGGKIQHVLWKPDQQVLLQGGRVTEPFYGGEEFGIILPDTPQVGAHTVAELLRAQIEALNIPHRANRAGKYVTISLGVATYTDEDCSLEKILGAADRALYQAKAKGRNMVVVEKNLDCNGVNTN